MRHAADYISSRAVDNVDENAQDLEDRGPLVFAVADG